MKPSLFLSSAWNMASAPPSLAGALPPVWANGGIANAAATAAAINSLWFMEISFHPRRRRKNTIEAEITTSGPPGRPRLTGQNLEHASLMPGGREGGSAGRLYDESPRTRRTPRKSLTTGRQGRKGREGMKHMTAQGRGGNASRVAYRNPIGTFMPPMRFLIPHLALSWRP